ncbi:cupredoxin domain-containing protein [Noviherbaspirillum massiliense]|uniref:cupredoxin domain-containing protein n=1 Tax=Noviherbaspirillum massiliense TaxID=1465823 RepID=UPI0002E006A0|nr:cupredoxin family copper-binding protein [Noviherbaspirillum massiliense]
MTLPAMLLLLGIAASPAVAQQHTVVIEAMQFSPQVIEVRAGDTITWKNRDPFPHTVTAQDRSFDSGEIAPDQGWTFKAARKGTFPYVCTLHPTMKGSVVVK